VRETFLVLKTYSERFHWVIHKTINRFSAIPIDQAHEQNNEVVKSTESATENPSAFQKLMVLGPEQVRILKEFEEDYLLKDKHSEYGHHLEEGFSTQKSFHEKPLSLI